MAEENTKSLVEELDAVINRNLAEDGRLDAYDDALVDVADTDEDDDEGEDEDGTEDDSESGEFDLDTDFDWNAFGEMKPSKRRWPSHDYSVFFQPSAINRYVVDYLSLVARTEKVARVLSRVRKPGA